ncbi:outer membrane protein assembly factor BamD [Pelagibacterium sp. 26DY04]|uniref:outer membrane protein assembly factor BamD n=1 Tax=Pelagibacterium sp. 26DY04 TaxID=2967130 RepID=UPI002815FEA7|nr:outer membrane protein assembly factor BamD [Pelagibacterium sp. 26DY04]WMT85826.1 outer membrane protein assembly factor BamD [Pelagibacterium sp. 26DY04]
MNIIARQSKTPVLLRMTAAIAMVGVLAACSPMSMFSRQDEEPLVPPDQLYASALENMENDRYNAAIEDLETLERQNPFSDVNERARVMLTFANFRSGRFEEAVLAADRFLALYPRSSEVPYVLFLKGSAYYQQITDITRDQELAANAIETFTQLQSAYPDSRYAEESRQMLLVSRDQVAGKEMSVGRYYLGNGRHTAAINRFRVVVEEHETSTHVEEALYRLIEAYLAIGLVGEAQTAAAVLGTNYPSSEWYQRGFALLQDQGLSPQMMTGNWMSD